MSEPRKAKVSIEYNGKNITTKLSEYLKNFTYTDVASGESDAIAIRLTNTDKRWMGKWMPSKGDKLLAKIITKNWKSEGDNITFKCGNFVIDSYSFEGRPLEAKLEAVSIPTNDGFRATERTKTWKNISIEGLANEIAKKASISLIYDAPSISIKSIEQSSQNDCEFLYGLCEGYGLAMKVYNSKIIIFDEANYEKKKAVAIINETDMISWEYNTSTAKTYTGGKIQYKDTSTKKDVIVKVGDEKRILNINEKVDSVKDAELKIIARVNNANKKMTTMRVIIQGNPKIIASSNVSIKGLEKLDGKYAVDRVIHNVGTGYTMSLDLRFVQQRIGDKSTVGIDSFYNLGELYNKIKTKSTSNSISQYVIKKGDTLQSISKKYYGTALKYTDIYDTNKEIIETVAKAHGKTSSNNGYWIWEETKLTIP